MSSRTLSLSLLVLLMACGGSEPGRETGQESLGSLGSMAGTDNDPDSSSPSTGGFETEASASGASDTPGSATASDSTPPVFDVGNASGMDPDAETGDEGCKKVDVVFAVDNSGSMSEEHEALRGPVFDAFPTALLDINNGIDDFQLGVIDACPKPALFHNEGAGGACNYSTGANYMTSDSPALGAEFSCVTNFSDTGFNGQPDACLDSGDFGDDDEQPSLAAAESVSAVNQAGSNAGFVRDDAILFVVAITDEDEELADADSAQDVYSRIVAAKGGDVSSVVYLGIAGGSACNGPYGTALDATVAQEIAGLFADQGQGLFWDLCQGNLEQAFDMAISTIVDETCQGFTPPEG